MVGILALLLQQHQLAYSGRQAAARCRECLGWLCLHNAGCDSLQKTPSFLKIEGTMILHAADLQPDSTSLYLLEAFAILIRIHG